MINNNNNNNTTYPLMISTDHESGSSGESLRAFESSYNTYSPHSSSYCDYPIHSKSEAFEYNYWSTPSQPTTTTTTHNLLANPTNTMLNQIPTSSSSSSSTAETLVPIPTVHVSHIDSSTTISSTHHHHHIHQHLYPSSTSTPSPPYNDASNWLGSGDYQPLHSTTNPSSYRHYSTPCSFYHPTNSYYDPTQPQWTSPNPPILPIKFESPYSPPPSYLQSLDSINHRQELISKEEPLESFQQINWNKPSSSSSSSSITQLIPIGPKNPLNGKTRTRDKYRIVYTDQQRFELENEFNVSKYISIPRKTALSLTLSLSERQIKIWFQNRRAKERKIDKKRHGPSSSTSRLNHSNDGDSPSDDGNESSNYYSNYT